MPVSIREGKRSNTIKLEFMLNGRRCRETLKLPATPGNIAYAKRLLGEIQNSIARGTFIYAEYFPDSRIVKKNPELASTLNHTPERQSHLRASKQRIAVVTPKQRQAVANKAKSLSTLLSLPRFSHQVCGIYFLIKDGEIVYVGQSMNVPARVYAHVVTGRKTGRIFDEYTFIQCSAADLDVMESAYINNLKPIWNSFVPYLMEKSN